MLLDGVRAKVKTGLATSSFFMALGGGILAAVSMIGGWISNITDIGPWWTPLACFAVFFIVCLGDWAEDSIPNRPAVFTAMVWPSFLVASLTGECGAKLFGAIGAIDKETEKAWRDGFKDWTDLPGDLENAFTVFSLILVVAAITYAQRYATKSKNAAGGRTAGIPVAPSRGR